MQQNLKSLLNEIERESLHVQETFRATGRHSTLDDFAKVIDAFDRLEKTLKPNGDFSDIEAKIIGTYYSALAFRIADTSLEEDMQKFDKAESIIKRAEEITMNSESVVHKAKSYLARKKSQFAYAKSDKIMFRVDEYASIIEQFFCNDYVSLIADAKSQIKSRYFIHNFNKYRKDGLLNGVMRGAKVFGKTLYESARTLTFLFSGIIGASSFVNGDYKSGIIASGIAVAIPLSRYVYRSRMAEEMLGFDYQMPEFKSVTPANL